MKRLIITLLIASTFLTGCRNTQSKDNSSKNISPIIESSNSATETDASKEEDKNNNSENKEEAKIEESKIIISENISFEEVKDYIINDQEDLPSASRLNWSERFLNVIDFDKLYADYIEAENPKDDIKELAKYITLNSTAPSNWEELFKADLLDLYGETVTKLEKIDDNTYQAYVLKDGKEVPYVVVSSITGYFHG